MILKICYDVLITNNILIKLETLLTLKNDQTKMITDGIPFPNEYEKTFGELNRKVKMSIDHRFNAFKQIRNFF